MIILFASLTAAVVWLALIVAGCYYEGIGLFDLMERIVSAVNEPFNIHVNQYSLKFVLVFLGAYEQ